MRHLICKQKKEEASKGEERECEATCKPQDCGEDWASAQSTGVTHKKGLQWWVHPRCCPEGSERNHPSCASADPK
eukprot:289820-Prorocentrum_lima.AAC.1